MLNPFSWTVKLPVLFQYIKPVQRRSYLWLRFIVRAIIAAVTAKFLD